MADHDPKQPADKAALVEKNNCLDTSVTFSSRKVEWDLTHLTKQLPSQWAICTTVLESLPQLRPSCSSLENEENMKNMRPKDRFLSITKLQLPQVLTSTIKPSSMGTDVVQPETKLTPTERQSYFGLDAKQRLHQVYQKVAAQKSDFLESATDLASAAKVTYRLPRLDLEAAANPNQEPGEALEVGFNIQYSCECYSNSQIFIHIDIHIDIIHSCSFIGPSGYSYSYILHSHIHS